MAYWSNRASISRGNRGRGFVQNNVYIPFARSDQNKFEILSSLQDGDGSAEREFDIDSDGFIKVRKRQRVNTGGDDKDIASSAAQFQDADFDSDFENKDTDEKLTQMFSVLRCNQKKIEQKVDSINKLNGRIQRVETIVNSYNDRLKLLEFKSIDIEARSRRNNQLFRRIPESRDEDCKRVVLNILEDKLGVDELPVIEHAHRLGRFNRLRGPRPIIVAFTFFSDTEDIISMARSLRGTQISISRDYPNEITNARKSLWPQFKSERANTSNRVSMVYPAKLLVNGVVVSDKFPEWDRIMRGSRISIEDGGDQTSSNSVNMDRANSAQRNPNTLSGRFNTEPMDTYEHMRVPFTPSTHNSQNTHVFTSVQGRGGIGLGLGRGHGRGLTYDYDSSTDSTSRNGGAWGDDCGIEDRTPAQNCQTSTAIDLSELPADPDQNNEHDLCGLSVDPDQTNAHDTNSQQDKCNPPDALIIQTADSVQLDTPLASPVPQSTPLCSDYNNKNHVSFQSSNFSNDSSDKTDNTPKIQPQHLPAQDSSSYTQNTTHGNVPAAMATAESPLSQNEKQSSEDDTSAQTNYNSNQTKVNDKSFLSPGALAESLFRAAKLTAVTAAISKKNAESDKGTHRSCSKQRSFKPMGASQSTGRKKRSVSVNLDRASVRKPPDGERSVGPRTPSNPK